MTDAVDRNSVTDSTQWLYKLLENLGETSITPTPWTPPTSAPVYSDNNALVGENWTAYNLGVGGNSSAQMLARFDTDVPSSSDYVILGAPGHSDPMDGSYDQAAITANIEALAGKVVALGAECIITAIPPRNTDGATETANKAALNAWIAAYCATNGYEYADWNTDALSSYFETDDIHWNATGCTFVASTFDTSWFGSLTATPDTDHIDLAWSESLTGPFTIERRVV